MILSTHFITGAAAASFTNSPLGLLAFPLILHFLLDAIPHWEYVEDSSELKNKIPQIIVDALIGPVCIALVSVLLFGLNFNYLIWLLVGGAVSVIPDGFTLLHVLFPKNKLFKKFFEFHSFVHNDKLLSFRIGFPFQSAIDMMAVLLIVLPKL